MSFADVLCTFPAKLTIDRIELNQLGVWQQLGRFFIRFDRHPQLHVVRLPHCSPPIAIKHESSVSGTGWGAPSCDGEELFDRHPELWLPLVCYAPHCSIESNSWASGRGFFIGCLLGIQRFDQIQLAAGQDVSSAIIVILFFFLFPMQAVSSGNLVCQCSGIATCATMLRRLWH